VFRASVILLNDVMHEVETGQVQTSQQLQQSVEKKLEALRADYSAAHKDFEQPKPAASQP
jgi:hypothetical protein